MLKDVRRRISNLLGLIGIVDTGVVLSFHGGINLGTLLPGLIGAGLLLWGIFQWEWKRRDFGLPLFGGRFKVLSRIARGGLLLLLVSFILIEGFILWNTQSQEKGQGTDLIILGAGLNGDQLSWTLWERMEKGLEYLKLHPEVRVIVSGGQGPGEMIPEAEAMKRFLVENGIQENRIFKEDRSKSTMENFRYSRELLTQITGSPKPHPVLVITSDFHLFRAKFLARRNGLIPTGIPSPTPWYLRPNSYLREYFAVVKSFIFDR